jgi:hypothetical protein
MAFVQERGGSVLSLITQLEAISEQTEQMTYSLERAARITEKSVATLRRAIKAGHLEASKDERQAYQLNLTDLEAWAGRPLVSQNLIAVDGLEAARAELETVRAELEAARRELDAKQIEIGHLKKLLEVQADALTLAQQAAQDAHEDKQRARQTEQVLAASLAAVTRQLDALPAGRSSRRWLRTQKTAD